MAGVDTKGRSSVGGETDGQVSNALLVYLNQEQRRDNRSSSLCGTGGESSGHGAGDRAQQTRARGLLYLRARPRVQTTRRGRRGEKGAPSKIRMIETRQLVCFLPTFSDSASSCYLLLALLLFFFSFLWMMTAFSGMHLQPKAREVLIDHCSGLLGLLCTVFKLWLTVLAYAFSDIFIYILNVFIRCSNLLLAPLRPLGFLDS